MHEIYVNNKNVTNLVGDLSWSSDIETLGVQLEFSIAYILNKKNYSIEPVKPGDIVVLKNNGKTIFTGVAVVVAKDGYQPRKITCFDFAFYLNKNEIIIQFNKYSADEAIKKLLLKFGNIKSSITKMPVIINKIYKDVEASSIIKDIIEITSEQTGEKYRLEMRDTVLVIENQKNLVVNAVTTHIINPKRTVSIQDMKNSIQVVSSTEGAVKILASAKDDNSIKKYGLLQMVHTIDDEEISKAKTIADKVFKEYNKIFEENSIELIGNDDVRAGRILRVHEPTTGINGIYVIKNVSHKVSSGVHLMSINLEVA